MTTGPLEKTILDLAESRLAAVRERCGDQLGIILENLCGTDVTAAVQLERIARKYGVLMIEEATSNFNPALYGEIARRVETPLATGERFHTRWGFESAAQTGSYFCDSAGYHQLRRPIRGQEDLRPGTHL